MKTHKALVVKPIFGGDTSLNIAELDSLLSDGWTVFSTEASSNGAILVILEKESA